MAKTQSFYAKVSRFLESYLTIPKDTYNYEQNGNLTKVAIKNCVDFLISRGVFANENDIKTQAFKDFNIILPDWVFGEECESKLMELALDLINRLQAENEGLKSLNKNHKNMISMLNKPFNQIKAEAYKEFAERLKKGSYRIAIGSAITENRYVAQNNIDNLLKELVGDNNV